MTDVYPLIISVMFECGYIVREKRGSVYFGRIVEDRIERLCYLDTDEFYPIHAELVEKIKTENTDALYELALVDDKFNLEHSVELAMRTLYVYDNNLETIGKSEDDVPTTRYTCNERIAALTYFIDELRFKLSEDEFYVIKTLIDGKSGGTMSRAIDDDRLRSIATDILESGFCP